MTLERKLTDFFGNEITDPAWIQDELFKYMDFDDAAPLIDPRWTRHHIHKEIKQGRVMPGEILIIHELDPVRQACFAKGKKYYITKDEVERIRLDYLDRPKRAIKYCEYECGKTLHGCKRYPCKDRVRNGESYRQSLEDVATVFDRFRQRSQEGRKRFSPFNSRGERKSFRHTKRKSNGRNNASSGSGR